MIKFKNDYPTTLSHNSNDLAERLFNKYQMVNNDEDSTQTHMIDSVGDCDSVVYMLIEFKKVPVNPLRLTDTDPNKPTHNRFTDEDLTRYFIKDLEGMINDCVSYIEGLEIHNQLTLDGGKLDVDIEYSTLMLLSQDKKYVNVYLAYEF